MPQSGLWRKMADEGESVWIRAGQGGLCATLFKAKHRRTTTYLFPNAGSPLSLPSTVIMTACPILMALEAGTKTDSKAASLVRYSPEMVPSCRTPQPPRSEEHTSELQS